MARKSDGPRSPAPPALDLLPLVHASAAVARWLEHYWLKLKLPHDAVTRLAVTDDRQEFACWTGRRLNPMALGCYCYLPTPGGVADVGCAAQAGPVSVESATLRAVHLQVALPGFAEDDAPRNAADMEAPSSTPTSLTPDHRHLIFIERDLLPSSIEVTVAHELIHLSDRVQGRPRKHRCHGYDAISVDEAALTQLDPEFLRAQLREETARRELALRRIRPYRYVYFCPACKREYPRVRRYARPVSCGRCDRHFNQAFVLELREIPPGMVWMDGEAATL